MEINRKTRIQIRLQNIAFVLLFLVVVGLIAWLSQRYELEYDWTATGRNTLSQTSATVLQRIPGPVEIVAFARENQISAARRNIEEMINRYRKYKPDITLRFINPDTEPDKVRDMDITIDGEMIIRYQGRSEHVTILKEETITNTLQRLLRSSEKKILFVDGHGERAPHGQANFDYNQFSEQLSSKGINTDQINLIEQPLIPADTAVLVIASPRVDYLDGELQLIRDYVKKGGNLLWLQEPGELYNLDKLAGDLHLRFVPGVIVDPTTQLLGLDDPTFALIARYGKHPITKDFSFMTLFPRATALEFSGENEDNNNSWQADAFLITVERSWSETGPLEGVIEYQPDSDTLGPLNLGFALSRNINTATDEQSNAEKQVEADKAQKTQRIVILGDGDFISNTYLGNQGNQNMGYNIINWLSHDDNFIAIPQMKAIDTELNLSETNWALLGLFFLIGIPLALLLSGMFIWLKRRKR